MEADRLIWLSGLALVDGGLLAAIGWLLFAAIDPSHEGYSERRWLPFNLLIIFGGMFMILGLPGFYIFQAEQAGLLGLLAFVLLSAGLMLSYIGVHSIETFSMPNVPASMMILVTIAVPCLILGGLLTGIVTWQAGVYPTWLALAILLSTALFLVMQVVPLPDWLGRNVIPAIFGAVVAAAGIVLMTQF